MTKKFLIFIFLAILLVSGGAGLRKEREYSKNNRVLISRDVLFGNPDRVTARMRPDGSKLSFLAPEAESLMSLWDRQTHPRRLDQSQMIPLAGYVATPGVTPVSI